MTRLKKLIKDRKIKQTWLASKLGISDTMLNFYLAGRQKIKKEMLARIALELQVSYKYLTGEKDEVYDVIESRLIFPNLEIIKNDAGLWMKFYTEYEDFMHYVETNPVINEWIKNTFGGRV